MNSTCHVEQRAALATERMSALLTLGQYAEARSHVFGSSESLRWFMRKHQDELVTSGALLRLTDRWMIQPEVFDAAVLEIGARAAGGAAA
jgi:hypothetical protein